MVVQFHRYLQWCQSDFKLFHLVVRNLRRLVTLNVVATWSAEERWLQTSHGFHEVNAVAVRAVIVGWREETEQVEVDRTTRISGIPGEVQSVVRIRCVMAWVEGVVVLSPASFLRCNIHRGFGVARTSLVRQELNAEVAAKASLDPERALVLPICDCRETPEAIIVEAYTVACATNDFQRAWQGRGEWSGEILQREGAATNGVPEGDRLREDVIALKRTILDKFRVSERA